MLSKDIQPPTRLASPDLLQLLRDGNLTFGDASPVVRAPVQELSTATLSSLLSDVLDIISEDESDFDHEIHSQQQCHSRKRKRGKDEKDQ